MKRILFLLVLLIPTYLFAQGDSLVLLENEVVVETFEEAPALPLTFQNRRDPLLAGFLSYIFPGMGQVYNHEYEKAFGVYAVMGYAFFLGVESSETGNDARSALCAAGMGGAYLFSIVDAVVSAKKINKLIAIQMGRNTSMTLKPDFKWMRNPTVFGMSRVEPTLGLKLSLNL